MSELVTGATQRRLDLSKVRHDLRTPINHILGYCEMLLEEEAVPEKIVADLRRIHTGGQKLLHLIGRYLDDNTFGEENNLQELQHELRTPVNHIIGYSELLQEQAAELGMEPLLADLGRIHDAAHQWLDLMEEYLIPTRDSSGQIEGAHSVSFVTPGVSFQTARPRSAEVDQHWKAHILIVDDDLANRELLARRLQRYGARVTSAENGLLALQLLRRVPVDLVLLDLLMPGLDGYQVLVKLKADSKLRHLPVIMISGLDQEDGIARCLESGAEDYLTKPFNPVFLRARIGACLEKKHWRDQEQAAMEALRKSQKHLASELAEAGAYVQSLLPTPMTGKVSVDWRFQPSAQLGGDAFGYHWIDENHFAIYLLDVCGHGVGAALLSVSASNAIRTETLPATDFTKPVSVLTGLNRAFQMDQHNQMYFTIWYGVFDATTRELSFASGGHPPALLIAIPGSANAKTVPLRSSAPPIACLADVEYKAAVVPIPAGAQLLVFSDGAYEVQRADKTPQSLSDFVARVESLAVIGPISAEMILADVQKLNDSQHLEDDFSFLAVRFQ